MIKTILNQATAQGKLRQIDRQTGLFAERLTGGKAPEMLLVIALLSRAVGQGHICLPLKTIAGQQVFGPEIHFQLPDIDRIRTSLMATGVVGRPGERDPFILDESDRCYLARYHDCERRIADDLRRRSSGILDIDHESAAKLIHRLFPDRSTVDWQQMAAAVSLLKQFTVISGGPGTGKTYTVARILSLLQALAGGTLRIELAAPTGKAAARLHESIQMAKKTIEYDLADMVPDETRTVHRLLRYNFQSGKFHYNRDNPLHLDLLVLDESSMVDVPLMASLLDALPKDARLILLGDQNQLTSVEVGSLFDDICAGMGSGWSAELCEHLRLITPVSPDPAVGEGSFADSIVILQESYRFSEQSGISNLAKAVNRGNLKSFEKAGQYDDLVLFEVEKRDLVPWLSEKIALGFKECFTSKDPRAALDVLNRFRVLCALREGITGVKGVNEIAEMTLRERGMISTAGQWYRGQPLMITENHYGLLLFNGDTGIIWPDGDGRLRAWFEKPDGTLHPLAPERLPAHETAYAVTVHKSQGSEFEEVVFLLPVADSRVLSRELIYTAITRARRKLTICGDIGLLDRATEQRLIRYSGLTDKLWNG